MPDEMTMKAVVYERYGSPEVLAVREVPGPVPSDDQVLVRVRAVGLNPLDWHFMRGKPYLVRLQAGIKRPKRNIPGVDLAGIVESVGRNVTQFRPGDEVYGESVAACAEYVKVAERGLAHKPSNLSFEEAAGVPVAAFTALQGLRDKARLEAGQRVLVNGASGGVGTFAVQIAKALGAEVTGVCSTGNVDLVRSIGADDVIDYTSEDFTKQRRSYDVIFDNIGNHRLSALRQITAPDGTIVMVGAVEMGDWIDPLLSVVRPMVIAPFVRQRMRSFLAKRSQDDLLFLNGLMETGQVTPVIDRTYPLSDVVEAMTYLETMHARGKVVITI